MKVSDTYKTISQPASGILYKEKGSKFMGYTFPIYQEEQVKTIIDKLRQGHPKASHWCYAWRIGKYADKIRYRFNDDGEPANSAGKPIYGQLLSKEVTNILVVIVRYFGGTKLGVSGLVTAYRAAAALALEESEIVEKRIEINYLLTFEYKELNKVLRMIKKLDLTIISQKMELQCEFIISVRAKEAESTLFTFQNLPYISIKHT